MLKLCPSFVILSYACELSLVFGLQNPLYKICDTIGPHLLDRLCRRRFSIVRKLTPARCAMALFFKPARIMSTSEASSLVSDFRRLRISRAFNCESRCSLLCWIASRIAEDRSESKKAFQNCHSAKSHGSDG